MTPQEQAELILIGFPDSWSPSCLAITKAVAAALGEKDELIEALQRNCEIERKTFEKDQAEITSLQHEVTLLSEQNDRLHDLSPNGEPCACNYDESGTVCGVHRVYLNKVHGAEIARLKAELAAYAWDVSPDSDIVDHLAMELIDVKADRDKLGAAIEVTLELAETLNSIAEHGASYSANWGERVMQAVEPLRNVKAFKDQTLAHNRILLEANGQFLRERDEAKAEIAELLAQVKRLKETLALRVRYDSSNLPLSELYSQPTIDAAKNLIGGKTREQKS